MNSHVIQFDQLIGLDCTAVSDLHCSGKVAVDFRGHVLVLDAVSYRDTYIHRGARLRIVALVLGNILAVEEPFKTLDML